ncbi:MAG TPA: hypothetical protein VGU66_06365 [Candidatus Elarobacter sp.]|nr:hypothetical protein [Candidatus Elarobacter sp.]
MVLSQDERDRWDRFTRVTERVRFAAAHAAVRHVTPAVLVRRESALSWCDWRIEDVSVADELFAAVARPAEHAHGQVIVFHL